MKIMNEYTFLHLKNNKRYTLSIVIAITIASTLLCSLCIFGHTAWKTKVGNVINANGYWHGELWDAVRGDQLKYVTENPNVATTLIKGQWVTAQFSDSKRPYLLLRDADENYWKDMSEKTALMEGKVPENQGEIVLSKLFFEDNPSCKIGDTLTLPIGKRMIGNVEINTQNLKQKGETFKATGNATYTIVGKLDVSGISAYPGYIAMGYLERGTIQPEDELTVYMRMTKPSKIYDILPELAHQVGFQPDEYGDYPVRYNTSLLMYYGIVDKTKVKFDTIMNYLTLLIILFLAIGAFVMIIYNAFSLSANARIKQLGVLKSLGATPKQIKNSILYEGFVLCMVPIPIGIIFGYLFSNILVSKMNNILMVLEDFTNIHVAFSWWVVCIAVLMAFLTVLISAYIPAKRVSKMLPIEAVRNNGKGSKIKKVKVYPYIKKVFGIEGELAMSTFEAHKRTFRTAVISLVMCFLLMSGFICAIRISDLGNLSDETLYYDMDLYLDISDEPSAEMMGKIRSIPEVEKIVIMRRIGSSTYVGADQEAHAFASEGGFASVDPNRFNILERDGKYRIAANIVGLDDGTFAAYCQEIGTDVNNYYNNDSYKGIMINRTFHNGDEKSANQKKIPLLDTKVGEQLVLFEKTRDDIKTDYQYSMEAGFVTDITPNIDLVYNNYGLNFVIPMEVYESIVANFMPERAIAYQKIRVKLLVGDEDSYVVNEKLTEICGRYLGTADFRIWSRFSSQTSRAVAQKAVKIALLGVTLLFGFIGLSNAFSTISSNLKLRRREFSMLRSVGLTPKGLNKMLMLEGLFFGLKPIFISIPFLFFMCWFMLYGTKISWLEFLPVFPVAEVMMYAVLIIATIWIAYAVSAKDVKLDNIVDAIKDETL